MGKGKEKSGRDGSYYNEEEVRHSLYRENISFFLLLFCSSYYIRDKVLFFFFVYLSFFPYYFLLVPVSVYFKYLDVALLKSCFPLWDMRILPSLFSPIICVLFY